MNNETRKIFVLVLTVAIIVCAFIPKLNPLPTVNNWESKQPLIQIYTDQINSSHTSDVEDLLQDAIGISGYADEYLLVLDNLIFIVIGILLVMFLIGVIKVAVSKNNKGFTFVRIVAILNTLAYAALIVLTLYQSNKLSNDTWGVLDRFIKITPSTGTYIGFIISFVLVFIAKQERVQAESSYNTPQYKQDPPILNTQQQPHFQAQSANDYNISTRLDATPSQEEMEIARLGNGYMNNISGAGASKSTGVTLTDKRLYLSGELFKGDVGGKLKKTTLTHVVDLQDIIGMEFKMKRKTGLLATSIILFVFDLLILFGMLSGGGANSFVLLLNMMLIIAAIGIFISYLNKGVTLFVVNSRTGSIGFDIRFAGQTTVERFAENIQTVKKAMQGMSMEVH